MNQRIGWIDAAKAIGIILMILGHCKYVGAIPFLCMAIYSFHMPLFFIISGMFLKPLTLKECFSKYKKAYIKPYAILCVIMFLITSCLSVLHIVDIEDIKIDLIRFAFGSGSNEDNALFHDIPTVGPIWFLLALFWGEFLLSVIIKNTRELTEPLFTTILLSFVLFFIGYLSARYIRLPLSIQAGMCAVPYLLIGGLIKKYNIVDRLSRVSWRYLILVVLIWLCIITTLEDGLNMASCRFDDGVFRIPISIFVSALCLCLCKRFDTIIFGSLKWLGKNTLYVLAGHQIFQFVIVSTNFEVFFLNEYVHFSPFKLILEFPIQFIIAITIGMVIKKVRLF